MAELQKDSLKMICSGMAFSVVNDLRPQGKFNFIQNGRVFRQGEISARPSLIPIVIFNRASTQEVPHSIKTIVDKSTGFSNRIIGVGTKVFTSETAIIISTLIDGVFYDISFIPEVDSGYSGKPLFLVDFRPEQSIEAYCYIADENKFRRISVSNLIADVGITAPTKAAVWKIGKPERKIVDTIEAGSENDWNNLTGTATAPTLEIRVNTTITAYIADGALPNFASIVPAAFTPNIQAGAIVKLNGAEEVIIEEVLPATLKTGIATISKILYDVGTTGLATIVLSVPSSDIKRDSILLLTNATPTAEYVRVQEVTYDDKGIPSFRVSTVATFAVGNTVSGAASFRFYTTVAYAATNTIVGNYIKSVISALGVSSITRTFNSDLTNTGTKPLTLDDIFHISVLPSDPGVLTEIQIQLDVGSTGVPFEEQYYIYTISPNFFTGTAEQTTPNISIIQQVIQRRQLLTRIGREGIEGFGQDDFGFDVGDLFEPTAFEATLGHEQWTELKIPLKDFNRVGSDLSRTLKDVRAIRVSVNSTAAIDISIDSIWVGGADALDSRTQGFLAYNYIWRIRDPATRVSSNWSPPLRTGIRISRGRVVLSFPDAAINYPMTYKIDIARYGGSLGSFRLLGSIKNDGTEYIDTSSDRLVADNSMAGRFSEQGAEDAVFDFYKPFAILDTPKKGTADITGNLFQWKTGDKLNITYPRGTQIVINGIANKFYTNPTSTGAADEAENVELEKDMAVLNDVVFEVQEPLLTGQPLPVVFGTYGEGSFGLFLFGLGDNRAAGTLYWLDGNSPDTMSDLNRLEITSPSEPLIVGGMYDGFPFVWTNKQSFIVTPTLDSNGNFGFRADKNANSRGVYSRYAIAFARKAIYHLTENADGIVRVEGTGNPVHITEGISNLFYNNGREPQVTQLVDGTEIYPPDYTATDDLRLFSTNDYVFFRFKDMQGKDRCLVFDEGLNDWISYDNYINDKINAIYLEELESSSNILVGIPDGLAQFSAAPASYEQLQLVKIVPFSLDGGDSNLVKEFKEVVTGADEGTTGFTIRNYYNNGDTNDPVVNIPGTVAHKRHKFITNLQDVDGVGVNATNITPIFEWLINSGVKLYEEIVYWIPQVDETEDRSSDLEFGEGIGDKLWQGVVIQADTFGEDKTLNYYDDRGILRATIEINHNGKQTRAYSFDQPFISHTIRRTSVDEITWLVSNEVYVFDPEPEAAKVWEGEFNTGELTGFILAKRTGIAYRSEADATLILTFPDGTVQTYPDILPNSNNAWDKVFFYLEAKKWEACKWRIESTEDIRIYRKACEVWMKSFNSDQPFARMTPFGGESNVTDVRI